MMRSIATISSKRLMKYQVSYHRSSYLKAVNQVIPILSQMTRNETKFSHMCKAAYVLDA